MPDDRGTIRQIAFAELFPWLIMVRALRLALQMRLLALAAVAMALTIGGWWGISAMFSGDPELKAWAAAYGHWPAASDSPRTKIEMMKRTAPGIEGPESALFGPPDFGALPESNPIVTAWRNLSGPFRQLFEPVLSVTGLAFLLLCGLWVDIVWAFFGGVITRLIALQVAREERGSMRAAVRFVRGRYRSYFAAPLYPLLGVLLFVVPVALVGLIGHLGSAGLLTLGIIWPLFLLAGLVITILLVGLLFGWALMWPTLSAEGSDGFDALSRTYSYVYQRPLYFAFLVMLASVLGAIGWLFVRFFAALVVYTTAWAVSWGSGGAVLSVAALAESAPTAAALIGFWQGAVQLIASSFVYTYFFSAATIAYFLLRQQVDGTETDEVFVEDQPEKYGLPSLTPDAAGVPTVTDDAAGDELGESAANGTGDAAQ